MKIRSTKDFGIDAVSCLVYGKSGLGKTRMCSTAPNPIIISHESGLLSLREFDVPYVKVTRNDNVIDIAERIIASKKYNTICIDSISDVAEVVLAGYMQEVKDPRQAYGQMNFDIADFIRIIRDSDINSYFTAKLKRLEDEETGAVSYTPSMPGKTLLTDLPYFFDEVFVLQAKRVGGKIQRFLQTNEDARFVAKDRSGALDEKEPLNLKTIFNKMRGEKITELSPKEKKEQNQTDKLATNNKK